MAALNFPDSPTDGETFEAGTGVIYTYSAANDSWTGEVPFTEFINPTVSDVTSTPPFLSGTGASDDPYIISPVTVVSGGSAKSTQRIEISNMRPGDLVYFQNLTNQAGVTVKFNQPTGLVNTQGSWQGFLNYNDAVGSAASTESTYIGQLRIGSVYFSWTVTQQA